VSMQSMLEVLTDCTKVNFEELETAYASYIARATLSVQSSAFHDRLLDMHLRLSREFVVGKIRAIESWSNGESTFRIVPKPWPSIVDKLYRINKEENPLWGSPPIAPTIEQRARKQIGTLQRWITPSNAHEVVDDILRTKFVVPFVDGVIEIGDEITAAIDDSGLRRFKRFHAKDSGYHARHYYVLLPVEGDGIGVPESTVSLEIKVLTKMQDQLGELTHILYEKHRTGAIKREKKRKVAWQLGTPDFLATYLGHTGHFVEAAICDLKSAVQELDRT
jgi:ppGpp synthetase/RelA/SpoT-type nucleotidyltranferase